MPVKVRCRECGQGINAPDAARGKTLKCKSCGAGVRVPAGDGGGERRPRRKKKPAKKRAKRAPDTSLDDDDFFSNLDLGRTEDRNTQLCPKCATVIDEEDIECPGCGINLETGKLSAKQKLKQTGPDPDEYFSELWPNTWQFLCDNVGLGLRLSMTWGLYMAIAITFVVAAYEESIHPECKLPLVWFYTFVATFGSFAAQGTFGQLIMAVVKATEEKRDKMDRFEFDFFSCVAQGVKFSVWSYVLTLPIIIVASTVLGILTWTETINPAENQTPYLIASAVIYFLPIWTFPTAIAHMSAKYTYKAYLPIDMIVFTSKNIKAVMFWWLLTLSVSLVGIAGLVLVFEVFRPELYQAYWDMINWIKEAADMGDFVNWIISEIAAFLALGLSFFILAAPLAFPGLMSMRACGLLSYYNARTLGTRQRRNGGDACGFWPRYLAYLVDLAVVYSLTIIVWILCYGLAIFIMWCGYPGITFFLDIIFYLWLFTFPILYFAMQESSPSRATLGMNGLGICVVDEKGNGPIMKAAAFNRAILRVVFHLLRDIPFLVCFVDKEQKAPHDRASSTQVVWRHEF